MKFNQSEFNFDDPERLKQEGMKAALDHAEREEPGWTAKCFEMFVKWLAPFPVGHRFLMEEFNNWALDNGLEYPPSCNSFGHLPQKAARRKMIHSVDLTKGKIGRSHAGWIHVWEKN